MKYKGHLVLEAAGMRAVAIPRDLRVRPKCYHCALFTQKPGRAVACPVDRDNRLLCDLMGIKWMRIERPAEQTRALAAAAQQRAEEPGGSIGNSGNREGTVPA